MKQQKSESGFFEIDKQGLDYLQTQWQELLSHYASDENGIKNLFESVALHYSEKGRFYHNLSHVKAMLESGDRVKSIEDRASVRMAVWFHDVIYNTRKSDNEERSAEMAVNSLSNLSVPSSVLESARDMILATKTHAADALSEDGKIFLDLDLSILGVKEEIYKAYSEAIRKEYSWVPWFLYKRSRKKILESFLDRKAIYYTEEIATKREAQARRNIETELRELTN